MIFVNGEICIVNAYVALKYGKGSHYFFPVNLMINFVLSVVNSAVEIYQT